MEQIIKQWIAEEVKRQLKDLSNKYPPSPSVEVKVTGDTAIYPDKIKIVTEEESPLLKSLFAGDKK